MKVSNPNATQHLTLDSLAIIPRLVRRLPPALAFRFHALPLAEGNGYITVATADPDDAVARTAVAAALGTRLYVMQADPTVIDGLLCEVWPKEN
jgi:hypothetical protein